MATLTLLLPVGPSNAADAGAAAEGCLRCHGKAGVNQRLADPARQLVLDTAALEKSIHADLACTDCHTQLAEADAAAPHAAHLGPPHCESCHEDQAEAYAGSVHGQAWAHNRGGAARCGDCHGAHDIVKVSDPRSRVFKMRLPYTCARCHQNAALVKEHHIKQPQAVSFYEESIHGRGLLRDGLIVAPSCTDCHGSHAIYPKSDPRSSISHRQVPATCAKCHFGIAEVYAKSIHGQLLAKGDPRGPVCIDCHTSHQIVAPTKNVFKLASDERCGRCHLDRLARYRETYHGKAIALGRTEVAACFDCHGHHDVLPVSNPQSRLAPARRLAVCQKCHPSATAGFTGYLTHANHSDRARYPMLYWTYVLMTALILGVFGFFGLHTILWFARSLALVIRDPKAFSAQKRRAREVTTGRVYVRFQPVDRFCHFLVIISFLLLVLTGMPLKFYTSDWAQLIFRLLGGPHVAATLHRLGAVLTGVYFAIHLGVVGARLWKARGDYRDEGGRWRWRRFFGVVFGPDSPIPNFQDLKDFWAHQKWFFGRGPRPQFDRWTYWEKFDYLGVFWGVAVIGLSGLVMWFPETVTRFLPGWAINVALIMHSDEALLAAGFIFTFHFFNVHFRVEKWPMDSVIFSGRITEEEMLHERKRLYDRLKASGRLEQERMGDEWQSWKRIFNPIGMLAFVIGVALIVAIYVAMARRLLG
ncbi:MAG: hypothetical protein IPL40_10850 [Proteobacteria bacterium]|nr:hypothetical protein [Pseudomonadota bacterium]